VFRPQATTANAQAAATTRLDERTSREV
jgi:hypothetical protein